ncbi:MAG TPA: DUF559 domain-containing protein [Ignavibacteria bacterium]|nr:DUF559 domain-containing protein [Ignavibacteria bacterium]
MWDLLIMSVDINPKLFAVATARCRELRRNSTESEKVLWKILRNRKLLTHVTQNITLNCYDFQVVRMGLKPNYVFK